MRKRCRRRHVIFVCRMGIVRPARSVSSCRCRSVQTKPVGDGGGGPEKVSGRRKEAAAALRFYLRGCFRLSVHDKDRSQPSAVGVPVTSAFQPNGNRLPFNHLQTVRGRLHAALSPGNLLRVCKAARECGKGRTLQGERRRRMPGGTERASRKRIEGICVGEMGAVG